MRDCYLLTCTMLPVFMNLIYWYMDLVVELKQDMHAIGLQR